MTLADRFWAKVERGEPDECWEWQACTSPHGYGRVGAEELTTDYAHRVSMKLHGVEVPDDKQVNHHCDNPPCVNPAHLYIGSAKDNMSDREYTRGEEHKCAKLTDKEVAEIRKRYDNGAYQNDLAEEYGVSQAQISNIVNGKSRVIA